MRILDQPPDPRVAAAPARRALAGAAARAAACALALVVASACGGDEQPAEPATGAGALSAATFSGSVVCAECHAPESERWRGSHHDRAMQEAREDTVLGDFADALFTYQEGSKRFFRRAGDFWVVARGRDGEPAEFRVVYTFGVEPLQQYLVALPDGRYQALDVAWDSRPAGQGGQRWFYLRPGESVPPGDPLHWSGIAYTWNTMCARCHSTDLRKNYDLQSDTYDTQFAEIDVACEACHGPASRHVEWARERAATGQGAAASAGAARAAGLSAADMGLPVELGRINDHVWNIDPDTGLAQRDPPVGPAPDVEACGPCHARRGETGEYRYGRPVSDAYRIALLEEGLYYADGQIRDEVFVYGSFRQSRMYQQGVGCGDCHEPHGLEPYNEGNALCNRCHLGSKFDAFEHHRHEVGTPGAACVDCHMPATTYMVVDPRRDHSFRVPRPDLSLRYGVPNACQDCHAEQGDEWSAAAIERWFGPERPPSYGALLASGRSGGPDAAADLRTLASDPEAPAIIRATALTLLPPTSQASLGVIAPALGDDDAMVRAGAVMALEGADPTTIVRLVLPRLDDPDRSVRLEAARLVGNLPAPQIPAPQRALVARALDEYRAAQMVTAERAQSHLNLGALALAQGDAAGAEQEYRVALRLEPSFVPSYINLADLYRLTGRDEEGEQLLRRALQIAPESGPAHHALGLLLVRRDRLEDAVVELRRATRLAPEDPHYVYVYAVAVQTAGDASEALEILDNGLKRFPTDRELLFGAAAFSRDLGDLQRAVAYARRLAAVDPSDGQAAAFLRELEARLRGADAR